MLPDYSDITSRLGSPLWWDEHGVPRYKQFHPKWCDIYAEAAALLVTKCQNCRRIFKVAVSVDTVDIHDNWQDIDYHPTPDDPKMCWYGDPPRHSCRKCLTGDTMISHPVRVLEFWERNGKWEWERKPEYEIEFAEVF